MRASPGRVVLVSGLCFPLLGIFLAILFWLIVFLLRNKLLALSEFPCMLLLVSPFLLLRFSLWRTKMVAQVDTLRLLTQPELTENQTARKSDTKEIKNKHSSRWVGGAERTRVAMAGPRLAECGTNGAGSPSTSRPCGPTLTHR